MIEEKVKKKVPKLHYGKIFSSEPEDGQIQEENVSPNISSKYLYTCFNLF